MKIIITVMNSLRNPYQYLTPLRGRIMIGLTGAVITIYIYNNYNNLPSYSQLKTHLFEKYFKPEGTDQQPQQQSTGTSTENHAATPEQTPCAAPSTSSDSTK